MPPPLGKVVTKKMPNIQVFGMEDNQATRGALRFFRERRIVVHFVDLRKKPIDAAELRRFVSRLGTAALLDAADRAATGVGLLALVRSDPRLLRLPLVRYGDELTAGPDETTWTAWLARRNG